MFKQTGIQDPTQHWIERSKAAKKAEQLVQAGRSWQGNDEAVETMAWEDHSLEDHFPLQTRGV